jgi:hypothetical protein
LEGRPDTGLPFFFEGGNAMPKMIALKRFHYPSGQHGKDYQEGEEVNVLTDRDAKALRLLKVAKDPPSAPPAKVEAAAEVEAPPKRRPYKRADMTAEDGTE